MAVTIPKLYEHPLSPFAQKVKLALYEKGVEFESVLPNVFAPDDAFAKTSPRLEVPSLVDGDFAVFDSTIILEYVEDRWPDPPALPSGPVDRARVRMIEDLCDTYYEAINWGLAEIRWFGRAEGDLAESLTRRAEEQIRGMHSWLERELGDRDWLNGTAVGWGDYAAWPHVAISRGFGFSPPDGGRLAGWLERFSERPAARRCAEAAARSLEGMGQIGELVASGNFRRQYRDHRLEWMLRSGGVEIVLEGMKQRNIRFSPEFS